MNCFKSAEYQFDKDNPSCILFIAYPFVTCQKIVALSFLRSILEFVKDISLKNS